MAGTAIPMRQTYGASTNAAGGLPFPYRRMLQGRTMPGSSFSASRIVDFFAGEADICCGGSVPLRNTAN